MNLLPTPDDVCEFGISVTEVFPSSATLVFNTIFKSSCSSGLITDGKITGTTITKIGKEGALINITVIPTNGSVFLGWGFEPTGEQGIFLPVGTNTSEFTFQNETSWYAVFDKDCSYESSNFCFNIDKDKLCSSCDEQKNVYFDNTNNLYNNVGITNNTYWYGNSTLESLITFSGVSTTHRVGWSFDISSSEISGGGTFREKTESDYKQGTFKCNRTIGTKIIELECRPSNIAIPYIVFLYKNNEKYLRFERTGNTNIEVLNIQGNPVNRPIDVYKLKYVSKNNQIITFNLITKTQFNFQTVGIACNGGYANYDSTVSVRPSSSGIITSDGFYSQLNNGQYSPYSEIYEVRNGVIVNKTFCGSDILECNSQYNTTGLINSVTIRGTHSWGTYNRTWSSKNLDITRYNNDDPIPLVTGATEWANLTTGAYCYYNNDTSNGNTYGLLYNWYAVNDSRGLAPVGWSIPTRDDIIWLVNNFENSGGIDLGSGGSLKEVGFSHWDSPNSGATNESGFTALPGGIRMIETFNFGVRQTENKFTDLNRFGYWWTSTDRNLSINGKPTAYQYSLSYSSKFLSDSNSTNWKAAGLSVRLIRN
jgi:uncharacterized protein (TIGR02145 family)